LLEEKKAWTAQAASLERQSCSSEDENKRLREENDRLKDELLFLRSEVSANAACHRIELCVSVEGCWQESQLSLAKVDFCDMLRILYSYVQLKEKNAHARKVSRVMKEHVLPEPCAKKAKLEDSAQRTAEQ
jgi:hypothetical protein